MALIGAGVSAAGSIASGSAQSASYKSQAAYADRQAQMAAEKGNYDAAIQGRANDQQLAAMRGQYLSGGVALSGSAAEVMQESATQASLDEQAIRYGAKVQSDNYRFQSGLARSNAKSAMTVGYMGALASGVNAFTSISQQNQQRTMISNPYTQYQRARSGAIQGAF